MWGPSWWLLEDGFEEGKKERGRINFGSCGSDLVGGEFGSSQGNGNWEELDKRDFFLQEGYLIGIQTVSSCQGAFKTLQGSCKIHRCSRPLFKFISLHRIQTPGSTSCVLENIFEFLTGSPI